VPACRQAGAGGSFAKKNARLSAILGILRMYLVLLAELGGKGDCKENGKFLITIA
jgi:hypothetical protein